MELLEKLDNVVTKFGNDFILKMKDELQSNGSIATGDLLNSITYDYKIDVEQIVIRFLSEYYGKYIENGREAGKYPPVSKIQEWCNIKGIPIKDSFLIAKHIYTFGIKPKPFIFSAYDEMKRDFLIALMVAYGNEVKIDIVNQMKQLPSQTFNV